jgi:energy-coupling factor transporter ATP-binding protein EcfA2
MAAISKITIDGFKAFPQEFELNLDGKNLLMYGENGSGKSSIYYALHALLQSQCKDKCNIYFSTTHPESIVNKYTNKPDAKVEIKFEGSDVVYSISQTGYNESVPQATSPLRDLNGKCVFINHKFLFNVFSFRNSQYIDLFPVFIKDILPFTLTRDQSKYISELYDEAVAKIKRKGRGNRIDDTYIDLINKFNEETKHIIGLINQNAVSTATDIFNKNFRNIGDRKLKISLEYNDNRDDIPQPNKSYWLRLGYRYHPVEKAGVIENKQLSTGVEVLQPVITFKVEELQDDDVTYIPIKKPQTYFNEAKLTAIALSIRFALLNTVDPADGRFLALDDMLISLDMSNRTKVVDFLLKISDKYKIYLFTHDKIFFEYFKHKTKKNQDEWVYKEIYIDDEKNPYIRNSKDYLGQAEHYIKQHEYEIAGNFLRKEAEAFCKDFLPKKKQLTGDFAHLDLNGLIMNCKDYAAESGVIDISIFNELDEHRKFILNPSSHDSYDVAKYGHEVKRCLQTLRKLREIIIKPFLKFGSQVEFTLKTPEPRISEYKFILTLCDDFRIIIMPGESPVISKGMINYQVYEDGNNKKGVQSDNTTIKHFFEYNYEKSDKTKDASYLNSVIESESGNPISAFLII